MKAKLIKKERPSDEPKEGCWALTNDGRLCIIRGLQIDGFVNVIVFPNGEYNQVQIKNLTPVRVTIEYEKMAEWQND